MSKFGRHSSQWCLLKFLNYHNFPHTVKKESVFYINNVVCLLSPFSLPPSPPPRLTLQHPLPFPCVLKLHDGRSFIFSFLKIHWDRYWACLFNLETHTPQTWKTLLKYFFRKFLHPFSLSSAILNPANRSPIFLVSFIFLLYLWVSLSTSSSKIYGELFIFYHIFNSPKLFSLDIPFFKNSNLFLFYCTIFFLMCPQTLKKRTFKVQFFCQGCFCFLWGSSFLLYHVPHERGFFLQVLAVLSTEALLT